MVNSSEEQLYQQTNGYYKINLQGMYRLMQKKYSISYDCAIDDSQCGGYEDTDDDDPYVDCRRFRLVCTLLCFTCS